MFGVKMLRFLFTSSSLKVLQWVCTFNFESNQIPGGSKYLIELEPFQTLFTLGI